MQVSKDFFRIAVTGITSRGDRVCPWLPAAQYEQILAGGGRVGPKKGIVVVRGSRVVTGAVGRNTDVNGVGYCQFYQYPKVPERFTMF
jgi:hypothetical protein